MNYSQTALNQLEKGQLTEFEKSFKLAVEHDSDDLLNSLAEELYSLGFGSYSKTIYEALLKKYPNEDSLKINLAELAIDSEDSAIALDYLSQISSNSENYVRSLMVQADYYQTQGLLEVSEQKLLEAEKYDPEEPVIKFALAEFYYTTSNYRKAIEYYLELIKSGQREISGVDLVQRIGVAYAEIGRFEQAVGYLEQIKPVDMSSDVKFELGFTYYSLKEYQKAVDTLEDLRTTDSQYSSLYPYLADAYVELNDFSKALTVAQEGLAVDQFNVTLWKKAADIALQAGEEDLHVEYLKKGLKIEPNNIQSLVSLSNWYTRQKMNQENIDLINKAKDDDLVPGSLAYNLAKSYQGLSDFSKAKKYYQIAGEELDDDTDYLHDATLFYRESGMRKEERSVLDKYLQIIPEDAEMQELLLDDFDE